DAPPPRMVPPPPKPSDTRAPQPPGTSRPPVNLRRDETVQESDRSFLDRQNPARPSSPDRDTGETDQPTGGGSGFVEIYQRTPYANAPLVVQQDVLRKVQRLLAEQGFYHADIDGLPGPATQAGILGFQRMVRLPMSGRLDIATLDVMRLLPGRGNGPPMQPVTRRPQRPPTQKVYRGIWID
ncbi:MAG: peptidoglycan-binding domain-containing protein, partial [Chthoniobacteraceae bacterium]